MDLLFGGKALTNILYVMILKNRASSQDCRTFKGEFKMPVLSSRATRVAFCKKRLIPLYITTW